MLVGGLRSDLPRRQVRGDGASGCIACAAGEYVAAGASGCIPCAAGTYSETALATVCTSCTVCRYAGAGASTCTSCAAGKYGPLPLEIASGLRGLNGIATSTLEAWTASGVREWRMVASATSDTCTTACNKAGLSCEDSIFPQLLSATENIALFTYFGRNYGNLQTTIGHNQAAPFCFDNVCYMGTVPSTCAGRFGNAARLCACGSSLLTYEGAGASTCTSCAAGKCSSLTPEIASGLRGLIGIAPSTLEAWTAANISRWKMGALGESCDTACINSGECLIHMISKPDTAALFAFFGMLSNSGEIIGQTSYNGAPACSESVNCVMRCDSNTWVSKCSTQEAVYSRLCAWSM
jgi:hypothetical protein